MQNNLSEDDISVRYITATSSRLGGARPHPSTVRCSLGSANRRKARARAELVARPVGLNVLRPGQANRAWDVLAGKRFGGAHGVVQGNGLKVFP